MEEEMSIMDALWSDILESSSVSEETSKFGAAMAHASGSSKGARRPRRPWRTYRSSI